MAATWEEGRTRTRVRTKPKFDGPRMQLMSVNEAPEHIGQLLMFGLRDIHG